MKPFCFIVGYGPGVGEGAARAFAEAGHELALFSRSGRSSSLSPHAFKVDAGNPEALRASIEAAVGRFGTPGALIYNAVAFRQALPSKVSAAELAQDFSTNVVGALVAAQAVLPGMLARGYGSLLFTGGGWALYPDANVSSTAIGKAGVRHLSLMLAHELQGTGVRAGTVTILGQVQAGTSFDPHRIGQAFLRLHQQPPEEFVPELKFTGSE